MSTDMYFQKDENFEVTLRHIMQDNVMDETILLAFDEVDYVDCRGESHIFHDSLSYDA